MLIIIFEAIATVLSALAHLFTFNRDHRLLVNTCLHVAFSAVKRAN